jgi:hypothetical protein
LPHLDPASIGKPEFGPVPAALDTHVRWLPVVIRAEPNGVFSLPVRVGTARIVVIRAYQRLTIGL